MKPFITFTNYLPRTPYRVLNQPVTWQINEGEVWAIIGLNGTGKSWFMSLLRGNMPAMSGSVEYHFLEDERQRLGDTFLWPEKFIQHVGFQSVYSMSDFKQMYYQQRFNATEAEWAPLVSDLFSSAIPENLVKVLNLGPLMNRRLIHLSSGELRRLVIAKSAMANPRLMVFDNPFIGLDVAMRSQIDQLYSSFGQSGVQTIFISPSMRELPSSVSHLILFDKNGNVAYVGERGACPEWSGTDAVPSVDWSTIPPITTIDCDQIVNMNDIEISYGNQVVQQHLSWTVKRGEKWALLGHNGSGKSTLLSYIFADNPQAYAKNISLFGRRRGTGETIWEIKKRIGYTSSEMHLYYREQCSCQKVVRSGFFDSIGLFRKCTEAQEKIADLVMNSLDIQYLADVNFLNASAGEQRMVLFARALVKNPEVLILDEPFHGLDDRNKRICIKAVNDFCQQGNKTLIFVTHNRVDIPQCVNNTFELPDNRDKYRK